ncbi:TetR/AcrR family transcriptional regulator C-terminal domain-containing protein [Kribbella sancticallisti]|uniref:TetR/AcrR family transcriptional regulator C-terminal domain-containing protein n=1 Tax=Kribbella sancticallisti TaxID=460087 RepID=A0ABP4PIV3_9ACTN
MVIDAALRFIDENGLGALSMHKLGATLHVKGMSLYNHVGSKLDLLDGVVEKLWTEVEEAAPAHSDWREGVRSFAYAIRDMVRRHPNAAALVLSQSVMPEAALRLVQTHIAVLTKAGFPESRAYDVLRTVTSYALGSALAEVTWDFGRPGCAPNVNDLLRPGTPPDLVAVAQVFCGQSDPDTQFALGLDLMLRGLDTRA